MFYIPDLKGAQPSDNSYKVKTDQSVDGEGFKNTNTKKVVVGKTIGDVTVAGGNSVTLSNPLYLNGNDPIYPVGYNVVLKASYEKWVEVDNETTGKKEGSYRTMYTDRFELP